MLPPLYHGSSAVLFWMDHCCQKGTAMLFPARPSAAAVVSGGTAAPSAADFAPAGFARRARHRIHGVPLSSPYYRSQDRFGPFAKARPYTKSADFVPIRKRARLLLRPPRARPDLPARKVHSPALSTRSRPSTHIAVDRNARSGSARRLALVSDAETSLRWVAVEGNGHLAFKAVRRLLLSCLPPASYVAT